MKNLLEKAKVFSSLEAVSLRKENPEFICSFTEDSWHFDYFNYLNGKEQLNVFFPSALVRGKRLVPSFHRWSWAPLFKDADVLCVSDPTLRLDTELLGGWFQGKGDDWVLFRVLKHIKYIQQTLNYKRVLFCGSSLGGYAALQAGILAPSIGFSGVECRVFSENPQVSLPCYMQLHHMRKLAQISYGVDDINEISEEYVSRLDIVKLMHQVNNVPKGLVVVKESDTHHHLIHVNYLKNNILKDNDFLRFEVIPSSIDATGHTPLNIDEMLRRIGDIYV